MTLPMRAMVFAAVAVVAAAAFVALSQGSLFRKAAVTFDPPYPQLNAAGDPILAIYEGRIPCPVADCARLKVGLVLYHDRKESSPSTYWLGIVGSQGNDRLVSTGTWAIRRGVQDYPDALVYELDANAALDLRYFWRVNDDILLPLDQGMTPKVGNAAWGYMLSRYAEPYGPRTYR
jgi:hypothetical protein